MRLSPKARVFVGAMTTVVMLGLSVSLYTGGQWLAALVLGLLGVYRGWMWTRELRFVFGSDED